jgi:regulator of sirC expression with transglutaminase-like and TPR domain
MADPKQLPHLIKLLDDESDTVRQAIEAQLLQFGAELMDLLKKQGITLEGEQNRRVRDILKVHDRAWLKGTFSKCFEIEADKERLEMALSLLAEYQSGRNYPGKLGDLLDKLAEEYQALNIASDPFGLADFLFKEKGLKGARADYYRPDNSNLVYVIEQKRGIPISLACIYILVGHRLKLNIEGCNFPGHFLARVKTNEEILLVDCYDGGRLLSDKIIVNSEENDDQAILNSKELLADSRSIVARVLRNLAEAYDQSEHHADSQLMFDLLKNTVQ